MSALCSEIFSPSPTFTWACSLANKRLSLLFNLAEGELFVVGIVVVDGSSIISIDIAVGGGSWGVEKEELEEEEKEEDEDEEKLDVVTGALDALDILVELLNILLPLDLPKLTTLGTPLLEFVILVDCLSFDDETNIPVVLFEVFVFFSFLTDNPKS